MYIHYKEKTVQVTVKKWGNSLAIRIPRDVVHSLDIVNDTIVEMSVKEGTLVIRPQKEDHLEALVEKITPENLHGEIDTVEAVGNEEW
jgi:antitoxin MazE